MGEVKQITVKNRTYYFYNDMINIKKFDPKSTENHIKTSVFTTLDILQLKKIKIVKLFTVLILCIGLVIMQTDIPKKKMKINT